MTLDKFIEVLVEHRNYGVSGDAKVFAFDRASGDLEEVTGVITRDVPGNVVRILTDSK